MNYGLTDEQFGMLCQAVDGDGSGEVDYNEFIKSFEAWQPLGERDDARSDNVMTCAPWEPIHGEWEIMKHRPTPKDDQVRLAVADAAHIRKDGRHVHSAIVDKLHQKSDVLRKIFVSFDADNSGDLDRAELRCLLCPRPRPRPRRLSIDLVSLKTQVKAFAVPEAQRPSTVPLPSMCGGKQDSFG